MHCNSFRNASIWPISLFSILGKKSDILPASSDLLERIWAVEVCLGVVHVDMGYGAAWKLHSLWSHTRSVSVRFFCIFCVLMFVYSCIHASHYLREHRRSFRSGVVRFRCSVIDFSDNHWLLLHRFLDIKTNRHRNNLRLGSRYIGVYCM